jgi:L-fuculokinase
LQQDFNPNNTLRKTPAILIFDIGKTNKKTIVFDEAYQPVYEEETVLAETPDEDGFPSEDFAALKKWIKESVRHLAGDDRFEIRALNFSAYGASFVHIGHQDEVVTPIYNYLKPFPEDIQNQFLEQYGPKEQITEQTASPLLGNLNSGLQLYLLKHRKSALFGQIKYSLHLPQFASYLLTKIPGSDITSIGSHTFLWNFAKNNYHHWVKQEGLDLILPPIFSFDKTAVIEYAGKKMIAGLGLHDSSAALIPYLHSFPEPFLLISTGTWCISLNPFNRTLLTGGEIEQDCLCYLSYTGKPIKASRLFAGYELGRQLKRLSEHYHLPYDYFKTVNYDPKLLKKGPEKAGGILAGNLDAFLTYEEAYHQSIADIIGSQVVASGLVIRGSEIKKIYVDGGFSKNEIYMRLLAKAFPTMELYSASLAQGSALGAALAIHNKWNREPVRQNVIVLKYYPATA